MKSASKIFLIIVLPIVFGNCKKGGVIGTIGTTEFINTEMYNSYSSYWYCRANLEIHIKYLDINNSYRNQDKSSLTSAGVCYSAETKFPTISDNKVDFSSRQSDNSPYYHGLRYSEYDDVNGYYIYKVSLDYLDEGTTYYWRAFIEKEDIVVYGDIQSFTTSAIPVISTLPVTTFTSTAAILGGNITNKGVPAYTSKGICYSTSQNPTTYNNIITVSGSGTGEFEEAVYDLEPNTTYYIRAFATNTHGTFYGEERSFKTLKQQLPRVSTLSSINITSTSATLRGDVEYLGEPSCNSVGICYSTSQNPSKGDDETVYFLPIGSYITGTYSTDRTSLKPNTTYYVRIFATNIVGTAYGDQISFRTKP